MSKDGSHPKEAYRPLLGFLFNNPGYCKVLTKVASPVDYDNLAEFLVMCSLPSSKALRIIQAMTEDEFDNHMKDHNEILRGNSVACKMHTLFVKKIGTDYFRIALSEELKKLLKNKNLNCEVDSVRLRNAPNILGAVQKNQEMLRQSTQAIFARLIDPEVLNKMPPQIRAIASCISYLADEHEVDKLPLIGGFIWLRYFNPVICTPDSAGVVPPQLQPITGKQRRNLVLITKLLQNLANDVEFGNKEEYMMCMNPFLKDNQVAMNQFLHQVTEAPGPVTEGDIPYRELFMNDDPINVVDVREKYLLKFHRFCVQYREKITTVLRKSEETSTTDTSTIVLNSEFISLLQELGDPPSTLGVEEPEEDIIPIKPIPVAKSSGEGGCGCVIQ